MSQHDPQDRTDAGDARMERAKDRALGRHDSNPSAGDLVGEAAGGISGVVAGAAIGSAGGPIGTLIGGIAGALGGWWSGRAISEAAGTMTHDDEAHYRAHWDSPTHRPADRNWDDARSAYALGHIAARNPEYRGRHFGEVEPELQRGWTDDQRARFGEWNTVRPYVSEGYARSSSTLDRVTTVGTHVDRSADAAHASGNAMERSIERNQKDVPLADRAQRDDNTLDQVSGSTGAPRSDDSRDANPSRGVDTPRGTDEHSR